MKKMIFAALLALTTVGMGLPAHAIVPPVMDGPGVVAGVFTAALPCFPCAGTAAVTGNANFVELHNPAPFAELAEPVTGNVPYQESTCLLGTASGTLTIGDENYLVTYIRVGLTALIVVQRTTVEGTPPGEEFFIGVGVFVWGGTPQDLVGRCVNGAGTNVPVGITLVVAGPGLETNVSP